MNKEQTDVNFKQRLIGAIVLVSLGVIIIPLLLNGGSGSHQEIYGSNIPPVPASLNKPLPAIKSMQSVPPPEKIESIPVEHQVVKKTSIKEVNKENFKQIISKINVSQNINAAKVVPAEKFNRASPPKTKKITQAYTLQIASFGNRKNAFILRDKLRKNKFKAYIESVNTAKGKIYRLRVGPYLKYEQLAGIQKKIEQQFKLKKTIIVKYKT